MQTVLIVVHMLIVVALIVTILLQRSEGGALGIGGGSGSFFTGRGQASALTRATAILAFLFFTTSLGLTILASYTRTNTSVFEQPASTAPAGETKGAPQGGNLMDQLKKLDPAPAAPEPQAPPRSQ
ncbi:preprotein translocase subunit SecG [Rhodoblastus acidophilus]|uniref:Protein-export membrane protein SecG n=1 Tax=Rhodoblastus acidophilus TaxID=1074 RepID=A0A6N8DM02_RHOAC|nr:preprotein translocase subunit SecG [Rhodoblastus acidophilus]MCW2273348.1 preprotein translocase subunit SecG [Rhodoblastus acidophilus]MTV30565.1 preprotein translocase subunit SecG [Rhodoblastus acidophilus]